MCTTFISKGQDLIYGYNLDIDPQAWNYRLIMDKNYFVVAIKVGSTTYFTHGLNVNGNFANLPYMNGEECPISKGFKKQRIDLLVDKYIKGKISFMQLEEICQNKIIINNKGLSFHSLFCDINGNMLIVEPGYGIEKPTDDFALLTNFPVLKDGDYVNPFYGKERYDKAYTILRNRTQDFSYKDAIKLLKEISQSGQWSTKISFVYSKKEKAVYYFLNGDDSKILTHKFV